MRLAVPLLALALLSPGPALATKVVHRNLLHMSELAGAVFVGTCVEAVEEDAPVGGRTMPVTRYSFVVADGIKGVPGASVTFRHLGRTSGVGRVAGMPAYVPGNKYLLFLLPESGIGLTSPVGLFQGAFLVVENAETGELEVENDLQNLGLFLDLDPEQLPVRLTAAERELMTARKGAAQYETLIGLVRKLVAP